MRSFGTVCGPGAKVCRGGCRIAIFGVYRDKSRYLTFAETDRDNLLFPAIFRDFCDFPRQIAISFTLNCQIPGIPAFLTDVTSRYES